jgi:hypothetical protein
VRYYSSNRTEKQSHTRHKKHHTQVHPHVTLSQPPTWHSRSHWWLGCCSWQLRKSCADGNMYTRTRTERVSILEHYFTSKSSAAVREAFSNTYPGKKTGSGAHPASCTIGTRGPFPGGKALPGRDADHSPPPTAEAENEWERPLPTSAFMAWSETALALSWQEYRLR